MDNRTEERVLKDCIKRAGYKVGIANNAENRMIYEALIEKQIRDYPKSEEHKQATLGKVDRMGYCGCSYWQKDKCTGYNCCLHRDCPHAKQYQPWLFEDDQCPKCKGYNTTRKPAEYGAGTTSEDTEDCKCLDCGWEWLLV